MLSVSSHAGAASHVVSRLSADGGPKVVAIPPHKNPNLLLKDRSTYFENIKLDSNDPRNPLTNDLQITCKTAEVEGKTVTTGRLEWHKSRNRKTPFFLTLPFMIPRGGCYGTFGNLEQFNQGKGNPPKALVGISGLGKISDKLVYDGFAYYNELIDPNDPGKRDIYFIRFLKWYKTVLSPWIARYIVLDEEVSPPNNNITEIVSELGRTKEAADKYANEIEVRAPVTVYYNKDKKKVRIPNTETFYFEKRKMWPRYKPKKGDKKDEKKRAPSGSECLKLAMNTTNDLWKRLFTRAAKLKFDYQASRWAALVFKEDPVKKTKKICEVPMPMEALEDTTDSKNTLKQIIAPNVFVSIVYSKETRIKMEPISNPYIYTGYYYGKCDAARPSSDYGDQEIEREIPAEMEEDMMQLCPVEPKVESAYTTDITISDAELDMIDPEAKQAKKDEEEEAEEDEHQETDFKAISAANSASSTSSGSSNGRKQLRSPSPLPASEQNMEDTTSFEERKADLVALVESSTESPAKGNTGKRTASAALSEKADAPKKQKATQGMRQKSGSSSGKHKSSATAAVAALNAPQEG